LVVVNFNWPETVPVGFCEMSNVFVGPTATTTVLGGMFVPVTSIPTPIPATPVATVTVIVGLAGDPEEPTVSNGAGDGDQSIWRPS
jgi:hypothetical protein